VDTPARSDSLQNGCANGRGGACSSRLAHRADRNEASPRIVDRQADPPAGISIPFSVAAPTAEAAAALCGIVRA